VLRFHGLHGRRAQSALNLSGQARRRQTGTMKVLYDWAGEHGRRVDRRILVLLLPRSATTSDPLATTEKFQYPDDVTTHHFKPRLHRYP
jgi:hypothetical protein